MSDRRQEWYLFHYTPPVDMGVLPVLYLTSPEGKNKKVVLSDLSAFKHPIVTHSFPFLVDWFRRLSLDLPMRVIDIEAAKKLIIGRPKSDFSGKVPPWDISAIMLPYLPNEFNNTEVKRALSTHLAEPRTEDLGESHWILTASRQLPNVWRDLIQDLIAAEEYERFFSIEIPTYQTMLGAQLAGIKVDAAKRNAFLAEVESRYLVAHHSLAVNHNIHVERALHDGSYLATSLDMPDIKDMPSSDIIETFRDFDPICAKLHDIISAKRNKTILLRTFSIDEEFCYPVFDTMGTVTGRIFAVDPQLQHLKKAYRSILVPRPGTCHLYIDYSQFEPSIMANMSKDPALLSLCRINDIYAELASRLFGKRELRNQAKTLFLAYSYGMGKKGLETLVSKTTGVDSRNAARVLEERFYGLITGVQEWRESIKEQLVAAGRIGTALGNYRNRSRKGRLDNQEERWSISQVVQGTGALILKRLICMISTRFPEVQILLPMHDALLLEIQASGAKVMTEKILAEFIAAFSDTCPGLVPQVIVGPFGGHTGSGFKTK